jgi:DNA-binding CsgD family transcriptional regulator
LLAEVAARGSRWQLAAQHHAGVNGAPGLAERTDVLAAEIAFASGDTDAARSRVTALLQLQPADTAVRIRAHILLGRIDRLTDLSAARDSFESALAIAQATRLPVHVLDALHELGTIELLDFGGTSRLLEARAVAARLGAMGTLAVIDLQLTAGFLSHLDTDAAERHSRSAHEIADRLGLHLVAAKAQCEMAEVFVQRRQSAEMERLLGLAMARIPDDRFTEAFAWGQCRGLLALFEGDWTRALACLERGMALLHGVANPEPVEFRAFWPLLLAHFGDERAEGALEEADATNLTVAFANRGFLGYARAILAGRAGDRAAAEDIALRADAYFVRFPFWGALARLCSAPAAEQDGWGRPQQWLAAAAETFREFGYEALAERCGPRQRPEVTEREGDVLALVAKGLSNKEIAAQLHLSSRTVEKHVESLLRKTGRRSRTQLALWAEGRNT